MAAVARVSLQPGAVVPGLKPGNLADRVAVVAALRTAMEQLGERAATRGGAEIAIVIPDAAMRVLLLDFESLPGKREEALPLVRFRLKKLVPFDVDAAVVSYQVMSSARSLVRVLAAVVPRDVLEEYESVVREAGFAPGAVLPSTLAALAAVDDAEPTLLVNAQPGGVTTAIVRGGVLLLHRSVDLQEHTVVTAQPVEPILLDEPPLRPLDLEQTAAEWAAQEPLPEHGRNPYAEMREPVATALAEQNVAYALAQDLQQGSLSSEIAQAVSVAVAYFEDTLSLVPDEVWSAGSIGAERVSRMLVEQGIAVAGAVRVREVVGAAALLQEAVTATVSRSLLAGVMGALRG
jgi:type IV pilus assembly protein PilM